MSAHTEQSYYLKALDAYPMNLEEVNEALGYALSYNQEHAGALYLLGCMHFHELNMPREAIQYYEEAMLADDTFLPTYYAYAVLLVKRANYAKATRLLDKAWNIPGVDKTRILSLKAWLAETDMRFKDALKLLDEARLHCTCNYSLKFLDDETSRINTKRALQKRLKKESKKAEDQTESHS